MSHESELIRSRFHIIVEIIEYVAKAVVSKKFPKKSTGNSIVSSFDTSEAQAKKIPPFYIYRQIIDGAAEVIIDKMSYTLKLGEDITNPAHAAHDFDAY